MNGKQKTKLALISILVLIVALCGCGKIKNDADALAAIDRGADGETKAFEYLLSLEPERQQQIGYELFISPDPLRGHMGIRLLIEVRTTRETLDKIEASLSLMHVQRRYSILASRIKLWTAVPLIIEFLQNAPQNDLPTHIHAVEKLTGLSYGASDVPQDKLAQRWKRYLAREKANIGRDVSEAISRCFFEREPHAVLAELKKLPVEMLGVLAEDLLELCSTNDPVVSREAAIILGEASDDPSVLVLFDLLDFDDYLTRYNAYNAIVKRTGMKFTFDLNAEPDQRRTAIKNAKKTLGLGN